MPAGVVFGLDLADDFSVCVENESPYPSCLSLDQLRGMLKHRKVS